MRIVSLLLALCSIVLVTAGCGPLAEHRARRDYATLDAEWTTLRIERPSEAVDSTWAARYLAFYEAHRGTYAGREALLKSIDIARVTSNFDLMARAYHATDPDDVVMTRVMDVTVLALHSDSVVAIWTDLTRRSRSPEVQAAAYFKIADRYYERGYFPQAKAYADSMRALYAIADTHALFGKRLKDIDAWAQVYRIGGSPVLPSVRTIDGTVIDPAKERGKVRLLFLYGPGCGPCQASLPYLNRLEQRYAGREFLLLGIADIRGSSWWTDRANRISGDMTEAGFREYLAEYDIAWPQSIEERSYKYYFPDDGTMLSTSYLIDREGRLVRIGHSWDGEIDATPELRGITLEQAVDRLMASGLERQG